MRPLLHPALTCIWRGPTTLQVGITPGRALVLGGLGPIETAVLRAIDGHNTLSTLRELAAALGGAEATADRLVDLLFSAGAALDRDELDQAPPTPDCYEPDRASVGLVESSQDGGHQTFTARSRFRVDVVGAGRVGAAVARLLTAGAIGDVCVADEALVKPVDVAPGGHAPAAVGLPRERSLHQALWSEGVLPHSSRDRPDVVVLAPSRTAEYNGLANDLVKAGTPHVLAQVIEVTGVVGPLVIPGRSTCLHCLDLYRTDHDTGWPDVLDQIARKPATPAACDASLASTVAGTVASQVLAFIDGYDVATVNGTINIELPYGLPRRRSWQPHPECGCSASDAAQ